LLVAHPITAVSKIAAEAIRISLDRFSKFARSAIAGNLQISVAAVKSASRLAAWR
jgi:hypothetical protein